MDENTCPVGNDVCKMASLRLVQENPRGLSHYECIKHSISNYKKHHTDSTLCGEECKAQKRSKIITDIDERKRQDLEVQKNSQTCKHDDDPAIKLEYVKKDGALYLRCPVCMEGTRLRDLTLEECKAQESIKTIDATSLESIQRGLEDGGCHNLGTFQEKSEAMELIDTKECPPEFEKVFQENIEKIMDTSLPQEKPEGDHWAGCACPKCVAESLEEKPEPEAEEHLGPTPEIRLANFLTLEVDDISAGEPGDVAIATIRTLQKEIRRIEYDYACVLCHATDDRMSKTNYTMEAIYEVIDEVRQNDIDELETRNTELQDQVEELENKTRRRKKVKPYSYTRKSSFGL